MSIEDAKLRRREFLTGLGAAAVAASPAATAASDAPATGTWDREVDVVCVGGGAAGCTAAVTAAERGASVVLVEKGPILGGTTRKSGGVAWIPNNWVLREAGQKDEKQDCLRYLCRFAYPYRYDPTSATLGLGEPDYKPLEAFYDNGSVMIDHLKSIGAAQFAQFRVGANQIAPPDYADHLPEDKLSHGRSLVPLGPDGKPAVGTIGDGGNLIRQLEAWLKKNNVPILTQHRATKLIKDGDRGVGLEAKTGDRTVRIKARKGVIFATGGYSHNVEYAQLYQKFLYGACALGGSTGDFIGIGGEAGARIGNMQSAWRTEVVLEEALQNRLVGQGAFFLPGDSMLLVNKYGKRAVNEKRCYNDRTKVHYTYDPVHEDYPNQLLFMVFDDRTMDAFGGMFPIPEFGQKSPFVVQGSTFAELATALGERLRSVAPRTGGVALSADFGDQLRSTVERYNGFAKSGKDPDFSRGAQAYDREWQDFFSVVRKGSQYPTNDMPNKTMYPLRDQGPYFAIILGPGSLDTNGGPLINEKAQVIGASGTPIAGLWGAGNCIASPSREAYYGAGGTIGLAMTFAYIAARDATAA